MSGNLNASTSLRDQPDSPLIQPDGEAKSDRIAPEPNDLSVLYEEGEQKEQSPKHLLQPDNESFECTPVTRFVR